MSNKVKILKKVNNNVVSYIVQAIHIKKGEETLAIPSPFGVESMVFSELEEAINQIKQCGYDYYVIQKETNDVLVKDSIEESLGNEIDYNRIADVFIKNLGHENIEIRNSAINSLANFGIDIAEKLIDILRSKQSWLIQQATIKCIEKIIVADKKSAGVFLSPLIEISETENTMVKSAALKALEKICEYRKE